MNYHEQFIAISSIPLRNNNRIRVSCPNCGGNNTLTITNKQGFVIWNCYKASCDMSGKAAVTPSPQSVRNAFAARAEADDSVKPMTMPVHWTSVLSNPQAVNYIKQNNCVTAYNEGRAEIKFDPKQNRVVFLVRHNGVVVDAAGRSLNPSVKPKWLRYGNSQYPYVCGEGTTAVIVEDCASATAVSGIATGIALLGTNLRDTYIGMLKRHQKVIVALDADATEKAIELRNQLSYYVPTSVVRLPDDLKYFDEQQIRNLLNLNGGSYEDATYHSDRL